MDQTLISQLKIAYIHLEKAQAHAPHLSEEIERIKDIVWARLGKSELMIEKFGAKRINI